MSLSPILRKYLPIVQAFVMNGGKRLRPMILLEVYKGLGGKENILRQAISVEFFHNATLILDDVMDEDTLRRNNPTVFKTLKNQYLKDQKEKKYKGELFNRTSSKSVVSDATLLANIVLSFGFECLKDKETKDVFNSSYITVNDGQLLDLAFERRLRVRETEYIQMAEKKTANLVMASMEIGAILAKADDKKINAIKKFALNIALAFQIADDLMDINPHAEKGHDFGSDIKSGKQTLMVIKAFEKTHPKDKRYIQNIFTKKNASKKQIRKVIEIFEQTSAIDYCRDLAENKVSIGKTWLKKINLKPETEKFFIEMADYFIERNI